jgi:hypothetical protein
MNTAASPTATNTHAQAAPPRRGCLFYIKRALKSLLGLPEYASQVSDAILDVIEAAQTGKPLASQ